jgi:hypothetical protein
MDQPQEVKMPRQGQQKGTPARRAEFIEYLRSIGPGRFCVYWPWSVNQTGYTHIHVDGVKIGAHRWVYEQFYGPFEGHPAVRGSVGDQLVLHHCDNPPCVRPDHLFLGDQAANIADAVAKGRMRGNASLSRTDIERITALAASGTRQRALAEAYGVSQGTISNVVNRRSVYMRIG